METSDEETLDLPMMSNHDISLVDHYIIDLSCNLESKRLIGSITLFMQPPPINKVMHSECSRCQCIKLPSNLSTQEDINSEGAYPAQVEQLSASEQTLLATDLKTDDSVTCHCKARLSNQQIHTFDGIKPSTFSMQCIKTSEGECLSQTKELYTRELGQSITDSKVSKTDPSSPKEIVLNQRINKPKINVSPEMNNDQKEDIDSLTSYEAYKDTQNPSLHVIEANIAIPSIDKQKPVQSCPSRDDVKIDLQTSLSHDNTVNESKCARHECSVCLNNLLTNKAIPNLSPGHLKMVNSQSNDQIRTCPSALELIPAKENQEESYDRVSNDKRKYFDGKEYSENSKQLRVIESIPISDKTSGTGDVPLLVKEQNFEVLNSSNVKLNKSASSSQSDISTNDQPFIMVLDACDVCVTQVKLLQLPDCDICTRPCLKCQTEKMTWREREKFLRFCSGQCGKNLSFATTKWSLRIWDEQDQQGRWDARFPFTVRIEYSTLPGGKSLKWVTDQDGNMTAFTRGDFINNRSLFPSQDHPEVLSTWQAYITVPEPNIVLMTGDREAVITQQDNGRVQFYYQSTMLMPSSTVALAIGQWQSLTIIESELLDVNKCEKWIPDFCSQLHNSCSVNFSQRAVLPCRVFAPESLLPRAEAEFQHYLPRCLAELYNVLGPHPFCRLDVLIVPSCFESLGMANPCLIFLSESVLVGNLSFCCRLSHEVSHFWFGLVLGPKDWTEEWMTEGFASFIEDLVHPKVIGMNEKDSNDWFELRALIKYRLLTAELSHTDEELQILRINEAKSFANETQTSTSVKNGLNPDKKCLQVHYLKGYFLLWFCSQKVGLPLFKIFLQKYVHRFHGQLLTSQDFLLMLFKEFPELREEGFNEKQICEEWLDKPGLPKVLENFCPNKKVELIGAVYRQVEDITQGLSSLAGLKLKPVCEEQLTLLLDLLLDVPCQKSLLEKLYQELQINKSNPDVRHRWCELVVKHKFTKFYKDVKHFLLHDQAMGIYLFGELMLSNSTKQKCLAEECFDLLKDNMDDRLRKSVKELIYG